MASYNVVANVSKAAPQGSAQRAQARPTTAPIAQPALDPSTPPESLRSLRLTEYPKSWLYNPGNPSWAKESVMSRMKQLERAYEDAGVIARPLVKDEGGIQVVRSLQYPSPAPQNNIFANKPFICVVKGEGKQRKRRTIELARLPEFEADGWKEWIYEGRFTELGTDRDPRRILKINDIWQTDAPYSDTAHMFAAEIETSRRADGIDWQPGQLLGRDPRHEPSFLILRLSSPPPSRPKTSSRQPRAVINSYFRV